MSTSHKTSHRSNPNMADLTAAIYTVYVDHWSLHRFFRAVAGAMLTWCLAQLHITPPCADAEPPSNADRDPSWCVFYYGMHVNSLTANRSTESDPLHLSVSTKAMRKSAQLTIVPQPYGRSESLVWIDCR